MTVASLTKTEYYGSINQELLKLIPTHISTLLEAGCGAGALGAAYKQLNPSCFYQGIEIIEEAATFAKTRLDKVIVGDVEKLSSELLEIAPESLDCIVYGDVLEHLIDPWKVVLSHAGLLKADGYMVACIPNVRHWSVINKLLHGMWEYKNDGIQDKTHLRFFTLKSIQEMFTQAGLIIDTVVARKFNPEYHTAFIQGMESTIHQFGINWEDFKLHTAIGQYIIYEQESNFFPCHAHEDGHPLYSRFPPSRE